MHSKSIYANTTNGVEDTHLVYVLYRDGDTPHYVGATIDSRRPYSDHHHARKDHTITSVEIVQERLSLEDASTLEDQLINHYGKTTDGGTLINQRGGGHGLGPLPEETKLKISQTQKGKPRSEETKLKISQTKKGKTLSDEHKAKLRGRTHSDETKQKIRQSLKGRASPNKGRTLSEEAKAKMSLAKKGKTLSEETKLKMSLAKKGRPSPNKGKTLSDEHKAKLKAAYSAKRTECVKSR